MFGKKKRLKELRYAAYEIEANHQKELSDFARSLDSTLAYDVEVELIIRSYRGGIYYFSLSEEELKELPSMLNEKKEEARLKIYEYYKKGVENVKSLEEFLKNGMPLFITLTSISNPDEKKYAMCYEYKKDDDGTYKAYLFTTGNRYGEMYYLTKYSYSIKKMTEEEFENHYVIGRLSAHGFDKEEDAIEYDNYLRRLFHGQREII